MLKAVFRRTPGVVLAFKTTTALGGPEIQLGDALAPEQLPAEAQQWEAALDANGNSVAERRRFDDRSAGLGLGTGLGMPAALVGMYAELTPWERITVGVEVGLSFWGPAGGGYVRFRPLVWGGEGTKLLHAFVLQASYTLMRDGPLNLLPCIDSCSERVHYRARTAQVGALSAGFEHQFASGWSIRYDFGFGHVLSATAWKCTRLQDGEQAPCAGSPPSDNLPVLSFAVGHTL
jgi:hypothetical protein